MIAVEGGRRIDIEFPEHGGEHIRRQMYRRGYYEKDMLLDAQRRVRKKGLALDIGAYVGTHAIWFHKVMGLDVVAFEPQAEAFAMLRSNIERNHARSVVPLQAGVGSVHGTGRVVPSENPQNSGMARFVADDQGAIPMLTIDERGYQGVVLVKIDVEGSELAVLHGARETIARDLPVVYVESTDTLPDVERFFAALDYRKAATYNDTPTHVFVPIPREARVSFAVMAHPTRARHIPYLEAKLGQPTTIVWDRKNDRWDTGRRSLLAYDPYATHHAVVQDDTIVCADFREGVGQLARYVPDNPICLYAGAVRPRVTEVLRQARASKAAHRPWFVMDGPWWGVTIVVPTKFIPDLVAYGDKLTVPNYDMRVALFFRHIGVMCYYTVPSLVDHRTGKGEPSLVPGRTNVGDRVAFEFIGENASALAPDWSKVP